MKSWMKKIVEQFEVETKVPVKPSAEIKLTEEQATLLFMIDILNKNLLEIEKRPIRRMREMLDEFSKKIMSHTTPDELEKVLFDWRQFYSSYRIAEYTYISKSFDDFKKIIWDFADQLGEDLAAEKKADDQVQENLNSLREAVESTSIETLKKKSREFINFYIQHQNVREEQKSKKITRIRKNLHTVKKQLLEVNESIKLDHLTQAFNRRCFDEQLSKHHQLYQLSKSPISMIMIDIDFFKKINDCYGHDIGDFVLKECVQLLKKVFSRQDDIVARLGGEEFCILLPDYKAEAAVTKAEEAMEKIRKEVFVQDKLEIRFTVSMGIAELLPNESPSDWLKRADQALYQSKNTGRNKYTVSQFKTMTQVA